MGLTLAKSAGLSIGKEGPFVHMSGIVAMQTIRRIPIFERMYYDGIVRMQVLSAASACGVAATFGAPFAGVLFSIEVLLVL